jgi:hypothetical protein
LGLAFSPPRVAFRTALFLVYGEHDAKNWQAAMGALLLVAEHHGTEQFAHIGIISRRVERVFDRLPKDTHWGC